MRRPSAIISPIISSRSSSLLDRPTRRADGSFTSRGSQQTWRSFSSASSTTTWLRARPRAAISCAHLLVHRRRGSSRTARAARGRASMRRRMVCFGGSSVATAALVRRRMNGRMRVASWPRRTRVAVLLDRRAETAGEALPRSRAGPASGRRIATTAHRGCSRSACRTGTADAACRAGTTACVAFAVGTLDRLRLVQHHHVPGEFAPSPRCRAPTPRRS